MFLFQYVVSRRTRHQVIAKSFIYLLSSLDPDQNSRQSRTSRAIAEQGLLPPLFRSILEVENLLSNCTLLASFLLIVPRLFSFGTSLASIFVCWQCAENKELQEKVELLEHQLASVTSNKSPTSSEHCLPEKYIEEFKKKIQSQARLFTFGRLLS